MVLAFIGALVLEYARSQRALGRAEGKVQQLESEKFQREMTDKLVELRQASTPSGDWQDILGLTK